MLNVFKRINNKKFEEVSILWEKSVFEGMSRTQIMAFKKKYKKLVLKQYNLIKEQEKINKEISLAKKAFLAKERNNNIAMSTAVKVAIGGMFVATVMATSQMSAMENKEITVATAPVAAQTAVVSNAIVENSIEKNTIKGETVENNLAKNNVENVSLVNMTDEDITSTDEDITSTDEDITSTDEVTSTIVNIEDVVMNNVEIEDNFVIFDEALERGIEMCENTQFDNFIMSKEVSVLDIINRANNPIVNMYFEMLFDTNINNKTLEYNVSYIAPKGSVKFNSREGGFFADIDSSKVEVRLDFNLQKAINDSIISGVDQEVRDRLFGQYHKEVEDIMSKTYYDIYKELIGSGAYLDYVKEDVATKLTEAITWEVNATVN